MRYICEREGGRREEERAEHACSSLIAVSQRSTSAQAVSFFLRVIVVLPIDNGPASMNGLPGSGKSYGLLRLSG